MSTTNPVTNTAWIFVILLMSCQHSIMIDQDATSKIFSVDNEKVFFSIPTSMDMNKGMDFSAVLAKIGEREEIGIFRFDAATNQYMLIDTEVDQVAKTLKGSFNPSVSYLAVGNLKREALNRQRLLYAIDRQAEVDLTPELCKRILCSGDFKLGELFVDYPSLNHQAFPFRNENLEFPRIPNIPMGGLSDCDQCTATKLQRLDDPLVFIQTFDFCQLNPWLLSNQNIRNKIIWRKRRAYAYDDWSEAKKADLANAFDKIKNGENLNIPSEPPHSNHLNASGELFSTELNEVDAWNYFIHYLAHTLFIEICNKVTWSLTGMTEDQLELLLDSETMFHYVSARDKWAVLRDHNTLFAHGAAMPGSPYRIFKFLSDEQIIKGDQLATTEALIEWSRDNMAHFFGRWNPQNMTTHWGYDGWPPVESILEGTTHPTEGLHHWTAGCWGTNGFLRYVMRATNIPVTLNVVCGHALPGFPTIDRYLSHGDDPYNKNTKDANASGADILINGSTFMEWFGNVQDSCHNVGRKSREFANN